MKLGDQLGINAPQGNLDKNTRHKIAWINKQRRLAREAEVNRRRSKGRVIPYHHDEDKP